MSCFLLAFLFPKCWDCLFVCPELTLTCLSKVMEPSIEQIDQDVTYKTVNQSAIKTESYGRGATLKWWGNCCYLKLLKCTTFADFTLLVFISTTVAAGWLLGKARMRTAEGKDGGWARGQLGKWNLNFSVGQHTSSSDSPSPRHVSLWLAPCQPLC